jgi:creatinine amidohydrolase
VSPAFRGAERGLPGPALTAIIALSEPEASMNETPLHALPNTEARARLATGAPAWLFINPVEYHGPHLSLDNDSLISRGLARDLHERLTAVHPDWPFLTAGELGMGSGAVPGPGSRKTPYPRLRDQVVDACRSLASLGARRVVLMTFHGDPMHNLALQAGVRTLAGLGVAAVAPMHALLRQMLTLESGGGILAEALQTIPDPADRRAMTAEIARDIHAGFGETSLSLHYAPRTVSPRLRDIPPCPAWKPHPAVALLSWAARRAGVEDFAIEAAYAGMALGWLLMRPFPGYTGRPSLANAEAGAILARIIVDGFAEAALAVFDQGATPPPPVLAWLESLTAGGRIY